MVSVNAILDLDLGNTRIKWRLSSQQGLCARGVALYGDGIRQAIAETDGALAADIERVRIASVVAPERLAAVIAECRQLCACEPELAQVVSLCGGVRPGYKNLAHLGVDRWLCLLAAYGRLQTACVVVGCGTAVTVDLIEAKGQHLGGYIVPGLELMRDGLYRNTNAVRIEQLQTPEDLSPGNDTLPAVNKGLLLMLAALIDNARAQLESSHGGVGVVLTGGDALLVRPFIDGQCDYNEHLVLEGLAIALP